MSPSAPVAVFPVDALQVRVYADRFQLGRAAALDVANALRARLLQSDRANVLFAAAASQDEFLAGLVATEGLDWSRVVGFHADEYLGLPADHPAAHRRYLREHLFGLVGLTGDHARLIAGERTDRPLKVCLDYEDLLLHDPADIVCMGIGEHGHLAFNHPGVADFRDPVRVKVVRLDEPSRWEPVHDSGVEQIADVPTHAYTLTVPALLAAPVVAVVVPGPRLADAVLATLKGPIGETCPATALRRHPGAVLYLDRESAKLVL